MGEWERGHPAFELGGAHRKAADHQARRGRAAGEGGREQLSKTHIVAPMTGRVTRLAKEEGEVAVPGTFSQEVGLLMTGSDLSVIQVKVQGERKDRVALHLGRSLEVSVDAFPHTLLPG